MANGGGSHLERRSAERFPVSLPIETNRGPGVTRDVSVTGLSLFPESPFEVGEEIEISLSIPDPDSAGHLVNVRLTLRGSVVRVEEGSGLIGVHILSDQEGGQFSWAF